VRLFFILSSILPVCIVAQEQFPKNSAFNYLVPGDSVVVYQCHVEDATQQLFTASGQTISANPQKFSITEKFVIKNINGNYSAIYSTSSLNVFPNRKFSGLKLREKPYWNFKKENEFTLSLNQLKAFVALEEKGKEANEYDFAITKYNTNQIIINYKNGFKQLVIDGKTVLSKLLSN
jgi:hypothetical protein